MRTTLTLDEDVSALLKQLQKRHGLPLKALVNQALRTGLLALETPNKPAGSYQTPAASAGRCLLSNLDDIAEVLAIAEGDAFH